jgi:DNA-binding transcriptional MerR regulator
MASTDFSLFSYEGDQKKEKSPTALRTISEASEMLDVPQHVLRFWETKFNQIKPLKRNGGRRFYRPQDLEVLQQIKHLLYNQGYTIKGAKKAVDEFIHARGEQKVTASEWMANIPPASVNDNFEVVHDVDMLAEIAQALNAPEPDAVIEEIAVARAVPAASRDMLVAIRAELVAARDHLRVYLPAMTAVVQ